MNKYIATAIGTLVGAAVGVLATAGFFKKKFKKEFDAKVDKLYMDWYAKETGAVNEKPPVVETQEAEPEPDQPTKASSSLDASNTQQPKEFSELVSYAAMYKSPENTAVSEVAERLAQQEAPAEKPQKPNGPIRITAEEYESDSSFTSMHLSYYAGNETLLNEDGEEIDAAMIFLMVGNLLQDAVYHGEKHIFIRNEKHGQEFEIVVYDTSYEAH